MIQMDCTLSKVELQALQLVMEDVDRRFRARTRSGSVNADHILAERQRLRVARRAVLKVHRLFKQGALVDRAQPQANCAQGWSDA